MSKRHLEERWQCSDEECGHVAKTWTPRCPICGKTMYPDVHNHKIVNLHKNPHRPYPKDDNEK